MGKDGNVSADAPLQHNPIRDGNSREKRWGAAISPAQALQVARAAGIHIKIDGGHLLLEAAAEPPAAILDLLSRNKASILTMLHPRPDGWSAEDWHIFFEERASIGEFEGGLSRAKAEAPGIRSLCD